jgi:hypothetical protein
MGWGEVIAVVSLYVLSKSAFIASLASAELAGRFRITDIRTNEDDGTPSSKLFR